MPLYSFPCMLYNLPDGDRDRPKHEVDDNWMYSGLDVVFVLTMNTDAE
jgi:hypothetical protein